MTGRRQPPTEVAADPTRAQHRDAHDRASSSRGRRPDPSTPSSRRGPRAGSVGEHRLVRDAMAAAGGLMELTTTVNDEARVVEIDGTESAVDVVRDGLGLTGTKLVCGSGVCGACTVLVDGEPVLGCLTPATRLRDANVTTVEGLADGDDLHPVQRAFAHHDGLQCGYCTPGFVVSAVAFHDRWRAEHGADEPDGPTARPSPRRSPATCAGAAPTRGSTARSRPRAAASTTSGARARVERVEAPAKVTGAAVYTTDVVLPGMLHAAIRRSDLAAGVVGPITFPDGVLGIDVLGDDRRVRWAGQPIAVVAAESAGRGPPARARADGAVHGAAVRPRPRRGRPPGRPARLRDAGGPQGGAERRRGRLDAGAVGRQHPRPVARPVPRHRRQAAHPVGPLRGASGSRRPRVPHGRAAAHRLRAACLRRRLERPAVPPGVAQHPGRRG